MSQIVDIPLSYTKDELLAALAERRKRAEKTDAKALREHRKSEQAYLREFRAACREALKWDYETLAKHHHQLPSRTNGRINKYAPSCPRSEVSRIDSLVAMLGKIGQERFTLSRHGKWSDLYDLLTDDVPKVEGLC